MNIDGFYHLCRSAAIIAKSKKITAFGSASILPYLEERGIKSMAEFMRDTAYATRELDMTLHSERLDDLIDGTIGELSMFDEEYGYYAHGTGIDVVMLPIDWQSRAKTFQYYFPGGDVAITAPHPHDTMIAKLAAGREKDYRFAAALVDIFPITLDRLTTLKEKAIAGRKDNEEQIEIGVTRFIKRHPDVFKDEEMNDTINRIFDSLASAIKSGDVALARMLLNAHSKNIESILRITDPQGHSLLDLAKKLEFNERNSARAEGYQKIIQYLKDAEAGKEVGVDITGPQSAPDKDTDPTKNGSNDPGDDLTP